MPAEGWYADGEPFERFGVVIEDQQGWYDIPGVRGDNATLAGRHGQLWRPKKYDVGRIPMTVGIHGANSDWSVPTEGSAQRSLFEENLNGLLRVIGVRHRQIEVERVHPLANGSTPRRRALCEVTGTITPQMTGYTDGQVSFEWVVPGAFFEDTDVTTYRLRYDHTGASEQLLEVYSLAGQTGYCSDPITTVTGPCTTVSVVDAETGAGWSYGALSGGEVLVVDAGEFTAVKGSTSVITALGIDSGNGLLEIGPAPSESQGPSVIVTATGMDSSSRISMQTRRKWLAA
jgi:hypothetical protein